jgi:hypothetical protein
MAWQRIKFNDEPFLLAKNKSTTQNERAAGSFEVTVASLRSIAKTRLVAGIARELCGCGDPMSKISLFFRILI